MAETRRSLRARTRWRLIADPCPPQHRKLRTSPFYTQYQTTSHPIFTHRPPLPLSAASPEPDQSKPCLEQMAKKSEAATSTQGKAGKKKKWSKVGSTHQ